MSVWMMNEPTTSAARSESGDRSTAAAQSTVKRRSGKITTVGFQGLTRAPSVLSE